MALLVKELIKSMSVGWGRPMYIPAVAMRSSSARGRIPRRRVNAPAAQPSSRSRPTSGSLQRPSMNRVQPISAPVHGVA